VKPRLGAGRALASSLVSSPAPVRLSGRRTSMPAAKPALKTMAFAKSLTMAGRLK